jgi:pyrophosphatase PpaX
VSRRYDAVLFDLDGTLIDSTELIVETYRHTLRELAGFEPTRDDVISGFGTPLIENLRRLSPDPALVPRMMDVYSEYNERRHDELVSPFPSAIDAVHALRAAGVALAIVTGKRRRYALMGLRFAEIEFAFDVVITPESTDRGKPHPEPVEAALHGLDVEPTRALLVGDSPHDMASARAAGVHAAAALWGPFTRSTLEATKPYYWLEAGSDVLELVHAAGAAKASA